MFTLILARRLKSSPEWDVQRNDVALLGCGAYGLPLALHAKRRGLSAVYVGAQLQTLLGALCSVVLYIGTEDSFLAVW